jgi:hypothetical protein
MREGALMTKKEIQFQSKTYYNVSGFNELNIFRTQIDLICHIV